MKHWKELGIKYQSAEYHRWTKNRNPIKYRIKGMVEGAKVRAKKHGYPININRKFLLQLLEDQNDCCAITGIPFDHTPYANGSGHQHPWGMSLDKIIPEKGYVKDNVRLVVCLYNMAKYTWTDEDVKRMATALVKGV